MLVPPLHLEPDLLDDLTRRAVAGGVPLAQLVNDPLRESVELIEAAG